MLCKLCIIFSFSTRQYVFEIPTPPNKSRGSERTSPPISVPFMDTPEL